MSSTRRLIWLESQLESAIEDLTDWLHDNTEVVFEEVPEIDDARSRLQETLETVQKLKADLNASIAS